MAQHNRDLVLQALRRHGALARPALGELIGVSPATINRLTTDLLRRGVIIPAGSAHGATGRPSLRVQLNAAAGHAVAVDVGAHVDRAALVDLDGVVVHVIEQVVPRGRAGRARVEDVQGIVASALAWAHAEDRRCIAVAACVPGVVDLDGEVTWAPALGWHRIGLRRLLQEVTGLPTVVENDANVLAQAEYRHGAAQGTPFMVALNLGEGIGAGIIADGRLYRGQTAAAGEIGYMLLGPHALGEAATGFGHLESRVGVDALGARVAAMHPQATGNLPTWAESAQLLRNADAGLSGLLDELADELAVALADLIAVLNPGVVVLGGQIGELADVLIPLLLDRIEGRVPHVPDLVPASLGSRGLLVGSAELAVEGLGSLDAVL